MNLISSAIRQPVTVAVGVILILLAGIVAFQRIPIQLTPNVEDTIIAVTTRWEGASPDEIEQEIVDPQEEKLQGIANLKEMTSSSVQGTGTVRMEFAVGTSKEQALREVSDKLREVPDYPDTADEPVVEASDPDNRDYIAWIIFETSDPKVDIRTLQDFAEDRIKPNFERVPGVSEINVLGGRERETQVRFDPVRLAQRGITITELANALRRSNLNVSAGAVAENKSDIRLRLVNQFTDPLQVEQTVIAQTPSGPVRLSDVATVVEAYKEPTSFVRSAGKSVIAINAQKEVGVNVMEVMDGLKDAMTRMNQPGDLLDSEAQRLGLQGGLSLRQAYDQTIYIDDALQLVQDNIVYGGLLAIVVLLLFLRSVKSSGIIALAIPISIVGAVAAMISIGRSINVISLAGMAFAIGMVVDNAIVVLENIFRHLEMGKRPMQAAFDGTREVFGAVVAATLTTVVVFIPILMIEDEAGQLFRDISLAIVGAVLLSLIVSVTVIPVCAARILKAKPVVADGEQRKGGLPFFRSIPDWVSRFTYWTGGSVLARLAIVVSLTGASVAGTYYLLPPSDYLPQGNRNLVFGLLIPPPGYNIDQSGQLAERIESTVRPFWEAGKFEPGTDEYEAAKAELPQIPVMSWTGEPGEPIVPPPLENYFIVSFPGTMFHGGISTESDRVVDHLALFNHATRAEQAPGVLAFAFQVPLFRLGGATGAAVKVNFSGDDLDQVSGSAMSTFMALMQMPEFGPGTVRPDPSNFNIPGPELQVVPNLVRLSEVGLSPRELGDAVRALGDGAFIGDYRVGGQNIDLKLMANESLSRPSLETIGDTPVATPLGGIVPLSLLGKLQRVNSPPQINRIGRRRSVTLQVTPPAGTPVEAAITSIEALLDSQRASGAIPNSVLTSYTGTASKLASVQRAMFGDGSFVSTISSAMVLALLVVYLLMCVLFQSFLRPLVIMFSVPLATVGGFAALFGVHIWSLIDPYMPVQNLDILTMLGFVILIGVVVNNAILIVHQARNFMVGDDGDPLPPRRAIAEAVRTRVRPIFMGSLTSVGGMAPLVFMPGSGSELYRGLGSVVVGGLVVSTIFTLLLVPALFGLLTQLQEKLGMLAETKTQESFGKRAAVVSGLLLLVTTLPGCHSAEEEPRRRSGAYLHEVVNQQLDELATLDDARRALEQKSARVEEVLGDELAELEEASGPASLDAVALELPTALDGGTEAPREIDLHFAVNSATLHNLGVQISREQVEIDREGARIAQAEFDPALFSELEARTSNEPSIVPTLGGIPLGTSESANDNAFLRAGFRQLLEGGTTVEASTGLSWADSRTEGISFTPDPAYRSDVALTLTQPLLRGRGTDVTTAERQLRRNQYERSEQVLREDLSLLMEAAESSYWDLVEAWKILAIQQQLTDRGEEVERVLGERLAFDATPAEYSDALATLESRRADLVRAQRIVAVASDRLKQLMNDPELPIVGEALLMPTESLTADPYEYELRRLMLTAIQQRPEVQSAVLSIEDTELQRRVAQNLRDAQLDLRVGASVLGQDGDAGGSYGSIFDDDHYVLFAGLSFELPVGNRAAEARDRQAMRQNRAAVIAYEQVVRDVMLDVKEALRNVRTNFELVAASRAFRLAQTENLRSLMAEQEARSGLSPEFLNLVFQRQEGLARAQLSEVQAMTDYNRSIAALHRAIGGGLRAERIDIERESGN
jgi:multidrug efflux pump subunit AcrB/outer membrane protein TolC